MKKWACLCSYFASFSANQQQITWYTIDRDRFVISRLWSFLRRSSNIFICWGPFLRARKSRKFFHACTRISGTSMPPAQIISFFPVWILKKGMHALNASSNFLRLQIRKPVIERKSVTGWKKTDLLVWRTLSMSNSRRLFGQRLQNRIIWRTTRQPVQNRIIRGTT